MKKNLRNTILALLIALFCLTLSGDAQAAPAFTATVAPAAVEPGGTALVTLTTEDGPPFYAVNADFGDLVLVGHSADRVAEGEGGSQTFIVMGASTLTWTVRVPDAAVDGQVFGITGTAWEDPEDKGALPAIQVEADAGEDPDPDPADPDPEDPDPVDPVSQEPDETITGWINVATFDNGNYSPAVLYPWGLSGPPAIAEGRFRVEATAATGRTWDSWSNVGVNSGLGMHQEFSAADLPTGIMVTLQADRASGLEAMPHSIAGLEVWVHLPTGEWRYNCAVYLEWDGSTYSITAHSYLHSTYQPGPQRIYLWEEEFYEPVSLGLEFTTVEGGFSVQAFYLKDGQRTDFAPVDFTEAAFGESFAEAEFSPMVSAGCWTRRPADLPTDEIQKDEAIRGLFGDSGIAVWVDTIRFREAVAGNAEDDPDPDPSPQTEDPAPDNPTPESPTNNANPGSAQATPSGTPAVSADEEGGSGGGCFVRSLLF